MNEFNYADPVMRPTAVVLVRNGQRRAAHGSRQTRYIIEHTPRPTGQIVATSAASVWAALHHWQVADARHYADTRRDYQAVCPESVIIPETPDVV